MLGNSDFELADRLQETQRDSAIHSARVELGGEGEAFCIDCGFEIPLARRRAMPSAKRCITCQGFVERGDF